MTMSHSANPIDVLRVLIVDDHALFRGGLATLLRENGIDVVGEAPTGEEGVRLAGARAPQVIVMDLGLPGISGIEAIRRIREQQPRAAVLVLTASLDEDDVIDALVAGATGYLLKDAPVEQIVDGLHAAANGDALVSPRVNRRLVERLRAQRQTHDAATTAELTEREWEVLEALDGGLSTKEIAERLGVSPVTVRRHISMVLQKLGVGSRAEALRLLAEGR